MNNLPLFTLLPPFYDPSPFKDPKIYLKQIEQEFEIKVKKYKYFKWAFGNDVFLINDLYIFRFPRTEGLKKHFKYEIDLLEYLKNKVSIPIPNYTFISKNLDFGGYEGIPWSTLTPSAFKKLSKVKKERIVKDLVTFLNVLHSREIKTFKKFDPISREYFIPIEQRIEKELKEKLFPKLTKGEVQLIEGFYKESKELLTNIPNFTPIHGDFYVYNIVWDNSTSKVGVIDFDDAMIADPARDFEVFCDFGENYIQMAYDMYTGPKDPQFLNRAENYYKMHGIYTLLSSLLGAMISYDYAYKYFFKEKFDL